MQPVEKGDEEEERYKSKSRKRRGAS